MLLLLAILGLPIFAIAPALTQATATAYVGRASFAKHKTKHVSHAHKKPKRRLQKKHKATRHTTKKHHTTKKQKNTKKHKTTKKKTTKRKTTKRKTPTVVTALRPPPTNTPVPTDTPTATPTDTPTDTPTPTVTPTPTPIPGVAGFQLVTGVARGYRVAFQVCGLPSGATATFGPNPVVAATDTTSTYGASARTNLTVLAPWTVQPNSYLLAVHTYFADSSGNSVQSPPSGDTTNTNALILTVDGTGQASLQATKEVPAVGNQGCSIIPGGYEPTPGPTVPPSVTVSSSVSDPHPVSGESVTIYGTLIVGGTPVPGILMRSNWYFPSGVVQSCDAFTGSNGTASCSLPNNNPNQGFVVQIQVTFEYQGQQYTTYSSYEM